MTAAAPPLELDPLIAEAKERARRRRLIALVAAGLIAAGLLAFELAPSGAGGGAHGTIPWVPAKPSLGPAPPLAAPCTASQLHTKLVLGGANSYWSAGEISIVNTSSTTCSLAGPPHFSVAGSANPVHVTTSGHSLMIPFDPLVPHGFLRAFRPGAHVSVELGLGAEGSAADGSCPGLADAHGALVLRAPGGGQIRWPLRRGVPGCFLTSGSTSSLSVTRFTPIVPVGPPSSALPLKALVVGATPFTITKTKGATPYTLREFHARAGSWLSYTVVLTNAGHRPYVFGSTCPAYTESWEQLSEQVSNYRARAYALNRHPVGSIASGQSVRFAMRIRVPRDSVDVFTWKLSPHTYKAPASYGMVEIHS